MQINLFAKGLRLFDGNKIDTLLDVNGDNLVTDGTNIYFAVNSLLSASKTGIFRVSIAGFKKYLY